jgi:hypothetical protein
MNEIQIFKSFLEKIAVLPMNPGASKPRPASASTTISAPPAPPSSFTVCLKPMRGDSKTLKMALEASVTQLRTKAAEAFGIDDPERCRLIKNGRALQDESAVLSNVFGLGTGEVTLHVLEKPKAKTAALSETAWRSIEEVLEHEGVEAGERKLILSKFQSSL